MGSRRAKSPGGSRPGPPGSWHRLSRAPDHAFCDRRIPDQATRGTAREGAAKHLRERRCKRCPYGPASAARARRKGHRPGPGLCVEIEGGDLPAAQLTKYSRSVPSALAKVYRRAEAARKAVEGLDIEALSELAPEADNVFDEIAAGYEEAAKRLRAAKKRATAERKKREKSTANAQGHKRGRTTLDEALSIPSQERAHDAKEDAAAG